MRRHPSFFHSAAAAVLLVFSCIAANAQNPLYRTLQHSSGPRSYLLHIPANYSATGPGRALILNMHGLGSNDTQQYYYSNFAPIADTAGFIMAVPHGSTFSGTNYWNVGLPGTPATDDIGFLSALIDTLRAAYNIDADKVYATGMSNGGYMSFYMACQLYPKIAAVASVTGSMVQETYNSCAPPRPVPVMQIHGTADGTVPYNGSSFNVPTDSIMRRWAALNGCSPSPVMTAIPNNNTADGCTAERYVWGNGRAGASNELFKIIGGGHTWPGSPFPIGVTNQDFSASAEIWRFFRQYNRGQLLGAGAVMHSDASMYTVRPNPATNKIHISGKGSVAWTLSGTTGAVCARGKGGEVDISTLPAGIYLLRLEGEPAGTVHRITRL